MGLKLISNDTLAPWNTKVVPPVTRGLEAWFTFDTDASRFAFNRAMGKANGIVGGSPVAFPAYGRFKGNANFVTTQVSETAEQTIIVVARTVGIPTGTPDGVMVVGGWRGAIVTPGFTGTAPGPNLFTRDGASFGAVAGRDNGAGGVATPQSTVTGVPTSGWAIRGLRTSPANPTKAFDLTANVSGENPLVAARVLGANKLRIASGYVAGEYGGESDISAVAIYSVALSDAEIALVATAMRKRMARLGITV